MRRRLEKGVRWLRASRLVRGVLVALASVVVLYFVAVNVLLRTRLLRNLLNTSPDSLLIDYRSASMWWPGKVHLEGFYLRNHDDHIEWEVRLDRADVRIDFSTLFRREFHVTRLRGEGVRFRAVRRLDPAELETTQVAALPPIEGYASPPRKLAPSPVTYLRHDPWSVRIEDVDLGHVREVWIDGQRYADDGRAGGSFLVRPGRRVWVAATYTARVGELHFGEDAMATGVQGLVDFRIDEVDPRAAPGNLLLRHFVVNADLDAQLPNLLWVRDYLPKSTVAFVGGGGEGRIELRYARGLLMPGTHVRLASKDLTAAAENGWSITGDALLDVSIAEGSETAPRPTLTIRVDGTDLALRHRWAEIWPLSSPSAALFARAHRLEILDHPFEDLGVSIDVPSATLSNLRALAVFLPPKTDAAFTGGSATLSGHVDTSLETGFLQGHLDVHAKGAAGRWAKSNLRADVAAHYVLAKGHRGSFAGDLRGSYLHVSNASVTGGDAPKAWWGTRRRARDEGCVRGVPPRPRARDQGRAPGVRAARRDGRGPPPGVGARPVLARRADGEREARDLAGPARADGLRGAGRWLRGARGPASPRCAHPQRALREQHARFARAGVDDGRHGPDAAAGRRLDEEADDGVDDVVSCRVCVRKSI